MNVTVKDREFLTAVAQDKLPRYDSLGELRRAANRLIRNGLLEESHVGEWTRYSLTPAGSAALADES